jgi:hypothetical protein
MNVQISGPRFASLILNDHLISFYDVLAFIFDALAGEGGWGIPKHKTPY